MIIVANILALISFIISLMAYYRKNKTEIFKMSLISNSLIVLEYFIIHEYSGVLTKIIAVVRDVIIVNQEKHKYLKSYAILGVFVIFYIISLIITYKGIIYTFPLIAAFIYTSISWKGSASSVRITSICTNILWIIYNICTSVYVGAISSLIATISTIIAEYKYRKERSIIDEEMQMV